MGFQVITGPTASKNYRQPKKWDIRASIKGGDSNNSILVKLNSNQDPTYNIRKLTNQEGNQLLALVEQEGRRGFLGHNFYNRIKAWVNKLEKVSKENINISNPAFVAETNSKVILRFQILSTLNTESL